MAWTAPLTLLDCLPPPNQELTEKEKFADDGAYFAQMGRYIVGEFWNPLRRTFMPGIDNSNIRVNDRRIENAAYYFGIQGNKALNYAINTTSNRAATAVFIPDQKIRSLVDYMQGVVIEMIQPLKDSISATGLTDHIQSERDILWSQLKAQYFLQNQGLEEMGISYKPMPDKQFDSLQDIDDFMAEWKHEYEKAAVAITENIYYDQNLASQFEDDGKQVEIGSLCSTLIETENGKVVNTQIPCWNAIYDYRAKDQYGKGAMVWGGVFNATPSELFAKYDFTDEEKQEINTMVYNDEANKDFVLYYNNNLQNIVWWPRNSGTVTYAILYWMGRKDLGYKISQTAFGGKKVVSITEEGSVYATNGKKVKAKDDTAGSEWGWMIHKCVLIGNKYCKDAGYPEYQVRTGGPKTMPMPPIIQLNHGAIMGYSRSVVDRLRQHADFRGMLMMKVQELVGNDIGKGYFIRASKISGLDSAEEILKDLKAMKVHVYDDVSGEANDPADARKLIEMMDMSLDPNIMNYIRLMENESREMEEIVNVPAVALGTQTDVIGKGVQQRTITQATMGQKNFYTALQEHWRQKLQYCFNVAKLLYTEQPETVKLLPISEKETYLLKVTKKFRAEDVGIYIRPNDPIEAKDMGIFEQSILGFMQNINAPGALEGLRTSLKLMKAKTYSEGLADIDKQIRLLKKENARQQAMQQQMDAAAQQQAIDGQQQAIILQQYGDLMREMKKIQETKAWDYKIAIDKVEATLKAQIDQKFADGIIKANAVEIEHSQAMQQNDQMHQQGMEQNDQMHEQAIEQQDNSAPVE